jgi:hypothetical protein
MCDNKKAYHPSPRAGVLFLGTEVTRVADALASRPVNHFKPALHVWLREVLPKHGPFQSASLSNRMTTEQGRNQCERPLKSDTLMKLG